MGHLKEKNSSELSENTSMGYTHKKYGMYTTFNGHGQYKWYTGHDRCSRPRRVRCAFENVPVIRTSRSTVVLFLYWQRYHGCGNKCFVLCLCCWLWQMHDMFSWRWCLHIDNMFVYVKRWCNIVGNKLSVLYLRQNDNVGNIFGCWGRGWHM